MRPPEEVCLDSVYGSSEEPSGQGLILDASCKQSYGQGQKVSLDSVGYSTDEPCGQSLNSNIRSNRFVEKVEQRECVRPPENKGKVGKYQERIEKYVGSSLNIRKFPVLRILPRRGWMISFVGTSNYLHDCKLSISKAGAERTC